MKKRSKKEKQRVSLYANIKTYGLRSVFFRYFFSSLFIVLAIFLPLIFLVTGLYNYGITQELSAQTMSGTVKSKSIFDLLTTEFNKSYGVACNNESIKKFLDLPELPREARPAITEEVYNAILPLLKSSDYMRDISIYSTKSKFLISSRTQKSVLPDLKPEWLETFDATRLNFFMIPRKENKAKEYNVLYTCQVIKDRGNVIGLFCSEVPYTLFENLVKKVFAENPDKMYIISEVGLILYCDDPARINTSAYMDKSVASLFTQIEGDNTILQDEYIISASQSSDSHLIIMSFLNRKNLLTGLSSINVTIVLLSLGALISAILLALFFSFRNYRSINSVLNGFKFPEKQEPFSKDLSEIYEISNTLMTISHSNKEIMDELSEKASTLRAAQIAALQAQINPHFLFNALQLINLSIIREVKSDNAATGFISDLSALLRTTYDTENYIVTVEEELEIAKKYLSLQQARYKNHLHVHFDIDESCLPLNTVKLILQPLVENAIVHGFVGKEGLWNIFIRCQQENGLVILEVRDDGHGIPDGELGALRNSLQSGLVNKSASIGITNVCQRIHLVFGTKASLTIHSGPTMGTTLRIAHPSDSETSMLRQ